MELHYTAGAADDGRTVLSVLRREFCLSAGLVRRLKAVQGVFVDGVPAYTDKRLQPGMRVSADIGAAEPPCGVVPQAGPVAVLYEDQGFLAVNKPAGLLVHPTHARYTGTLANFVAGDLESRCGDGRCHAVNRLDRDTSGVVLFAKNAYVKDRLSRALGEREKVYLAAVWGVMPSPAGVLDMPIRRLRPGDMMRGVAPDGQRAVTHYETLYTGERQGVRLSLLRLRLETGRTHQIRVHCTAVGCPLLGDNLYTTPAAQAAAAKLEVPFQQLHALRVAFSHPLDGRPMALEAPVPTGFLQELLAAAGTAPWEG